MAVRHKNKTFACLLACLLGTLGAHRLYLGGMRDRWAWLHLVSVPLALLIATLAPGADWFYKILPLTLSALVGFLESLVLGLMSDEQWDARYNAASSRLSASNWPLALLLVATLMLGSGMLIATMARLFDLLYTGGAYG
jgi:TM2 domain-containing membrane protein YozV